MWKSLCGNQWWELSSNNMSSKALARGYDKMRVWRLQVPQATARHIGAKLGALRGREILNFHNLDQLMSCV